MRFLDFLHCRPCIRNGWIFSPSLDLGVFIGLWVAIASMALFLPSSTSLQSIFLWQVVYHGFINIGHVFGTIYPLRLLRQQKKINIFPFTALGAVVFSLIAFNWMFSLFQTFLALFVLWHFTRQNVGWVHIATARGQSPRDWRDSTIIYATCLLSVLAYLANPQMPSGKGIFIAGDLDALSLPGQLYPFFLLLLAGYGLLYMALQIYFIYQKKPINLAKYVIVISNALCFCSFFIFGPTYNLLWAANAFVHGVSYTLFTYYFSKKNWNKGSIPLKNISLYIVFLMLPTIPLMIIFEHGQNILLPLAWSVMLLHYVEDLYIWRGSFLGKLTSHHSKKKMIRESVFTE